MEQLENKNQEWYDVDAEAEKLCRWGAARAGVIVVAPLVGTMALMTNEVYMITRLASLRGVKLDQGAIVGFVASLGASFVGQTLATLIPIAPMQIAIGVSVTYAVGHVADEWLKAGCPDDIASFKEVFEDARAEGMKQLKQLTSMSCKDEPLGDESKKFDFEGAKQEQAEKQAADKAEQGEFADKAEEPKEEGPKAEAEESSKEGEPVQEKNMTTSEQFEAFCAKADETEKKVKDFLKNLKANM